MTTSIVRHIVASAALVLSSATSVGAQPSVLNAAKPAVFSFTPYVGYMNFGAYRERGGVELSNRNAPVYGAQAQLDLTRRWAFVGNLGYAGSRWTLQNANGPSSALDLQDVDVWLYDANVMYRVPLAYGASSGISPFAQLGLGGVRYSSDLTDITTPTSSSIAYNAGVGVDWQLGAVGFRFMAKDYVTSLDWKDASDASMKGKRAHNWALITGLKVGF
jgi:hypothetical protein